MADITPSGGGRLTRKQREQRAYRLVLAGGTAGTVAVVGLVLAFVGIVGFGLPMLAAVIAAVCALLFRRATS